MSASARLQPASICARPSSAGAFMTIEPSRSWTNLARRRSASMIVTSCPDSRRACDRWNPTSPAPATTKYIFTAPPSGDARMVGDEWTEWPSLSSLHRGLHRLVDHVGLMRQRFPHEDLPDLAVFLQHRVKKRTEDGRPGERVDPHLAIGLRAHRVVHLGDHLFHPEDLLRDLRRHQIPVVPFGEREKRIGPFDPGLSKDFEIRAVTQDRFAFE